MRLIKARMLLLSGVLNTCLIGHPHEVAVSILVRELLLVLRRIELGLIMGVLVMLLIR